MAQSTKLPARAAALKPDAALDPVDAPPPSQNPNKLPTRRVKVRNKAGKVIGTRVVPDLSSLAPQEIEDVVTRSTASGFRDLPQRTKVTELVRASKASLRRDEDVANILLAKAVGEASQSKSAEESALATLRAASADAKSAEAREASASGLAESGQALASSVQLTAGPTPQTTTAARRDSERRAQAKLARFEVESGAYDLGTAVQFADAPNDAPGITVQDLKDLGFTEAQIEKARRSAPTLAQLRKRAIQSQAAAAQVVALQDLADFKVVTKGPLSGRTLVQYDVAGALRSGVATAVLEDAGFGVSTIADAKRFNREFGSAQGRIDALGVGANAGERDAAAELVAAAKTNGEANAKLTAIAPNVVAGALTAAGAGAVQAPIPSVPGGVIKLVGIALLAAGAAFAWKSERDRQAVQEYVRERPPVPAKDVKAAIPSSITASVRILEPAKVTLEGPIAVRPGPSSTTLPKTPQGTSSTETPATAPKFSTPSPKPLPKELLQNIQTAGVAVLDRVELDDKEVAALLESINRERLNREMDQALDAINDANRRRLESNTSGEREKIDAAAKAALLAAARRVVVGTPGAHSPRAQTVTTQLLAAAMATDLAKAIRAAGEGTKTTTATRSEITTRLRTLIRDFPVTPTTIAQPTTGAQPTTPTTGTQPATVTVPTTVTQPGTGTKPTTVTQPVTVTGPTTVTKPTTAPGAATAVRAKPRSATTTGAPTAGRIPKGKSGGRITRKQKRPGLFPAIGAFRDGALRGRAVYRIADINRAELSTTFDRPDGIPNLEGPGSAVDSYRVILWDNDPPSQVELEMGVVTLIAGETLRFGPSKRRARRRRR